MPRGRKPKPTALKELEGTRADRVNTAEPTPPPGLPEAPEDLDPLARAEWGRMAPMLAGMGVLTIADGPALALYCRAFSRMLAADQKTKRQGAVILTGLGGAKVNPYLSVASQARAEMLKILAEFGCTPSARSRIKLDSGPSQEDELAAFVRSKPE